MVCLLLSTAFPPHEKDDRPPESFDFLLEMVVNAHSPKSSLNVVQCNSTECLLEILCQLKACLKFPQHLKLLGKDNFLWNFIVIGLSHEDGLTRKRANYLLKRAVDKPHNFDTSDVNANPLVSFMDTNTFKDQRKLWDDFFLVIETLEEKQVHLVKQVFNKIQRLVSKVPTSSEELNVSKPFHIAWILVVYKLLFQHQNNAIVKWSVHNFLTSFSFKYIGYTEFIDFACHPLLNVLNSSKHYSYKEPNTNCETENILTDYLAGFVPNRDDSDINLDHETFWNHFLNAVFSISWGPLPLYHVTRAISNALNRISPCHKR